MCRNYACGPITNETKRMLSWGHVQLGRISQRGAELQVSLDSDERRPQCAPPKQLVSLSKCFLLLNKLYVLFSFPFFCKSFSFVLVNKSVFVQIFHRPFFFTPALNFWHKVFFVLTILFCVLNKVYKIHFQMQATL